MGLCTGLLFHTGVVALGVAAIFQASTLAFTLLKFIGAGYLLYLAWHAFRAGPSELGPTGEREVQALKLYRRGIIMNLTNPMHTTGVKQNTLRRRGLTGINMRHDADVSQQWKWRRPRHLSVSRLVS